jgi:hypothetical protein
MSFMGFDLKEPIIFKEKQPVAYKMATGCFL